MHMCLPTSPSSTPLPTPTATPPKPLRLPRIPLKTTPTILPIPVLHILILEEIDREPTNNSTSSDIPLLMLIPSAAVLVAVPRP